MMRCGYAEFVLVRGRQVHVICPNPGIWRIRTPRGITSAGICLQHWRIYDHQFDRDAIGALPPASNPPVDFEWVQYYELIGDSADGVFGLGPASFSARDVIRLCPR